MGRVRSLAQILGGWISGKALINFKITNRTGGTLMFHLLLALLVLSSTGLFAEQDDPLLLQKPTINRSQFVFTFAGDLWSVSRKGGDAIHLTSNVGHETDAHFSPDGTMIAFTGEYDGNIDVYVVPAVGGSPKRLTYHPGPDSVVGWTPDGKSILFRSTRDSVARFGRLFTIPATGGGLPTEVP